MRLLCKLQMETRKSNKTKCSGNETVSGYLDKAISGTTVNLSLATDADVSFWTNWCIFENVTMEE